MKAIESILCWHELEKSAVIFFNTKLLFTANDPKVIL